VIAEKDVSMSENIEQAVKSKYGAVAASCLSNSHAGVRAVAEAFGYSARELAMLPAEANMGLSCGNPTAFASLKPGEVVVDLGCGGGIDVLLAAAKVGPNGKAIGIDMTPEMLERARRNAEKGVGGQPVTNVEFHQAMIDKLPLPNVSTDCVISNGVINLAADKAAVFREIGRILKPGGRLAVSDIVLKQPLPPAIANDLMAFVGCIAEEDHDHAAQFLICRTCGKVTELEDHELAHALEDAARRLGFEVGKATIEAEGQCAACAGD